MKKSDKYTRARRADDRDADVGLRVRARRLEQGLSQTELAEKIGVTFQQVQKYERGTNRIGAGRLQRISEALDIPVSWFFGQAGAGAKGAQDDVLTRLGQTRQGVALATAFLAIADHDARVSLLASAEAFAAMSAPAARKAA
jgi:transcriptional regulator with XRE-family HTH domain